MRTGFVGIGNMGAPMAAAVAGAGFSVTVFDADSDRAAAFAGRAGVARAGSLPELAGSCDLVITMLPDDRIVRDVVLGGRDQGPRLVDGLARGAVIVDMSSSAPDATRRLGADLAGFGVALLDAPVSGGVSRAVSATLSIMVGGDAAVLERALPVLSAMGRPTHVGPLGSGHAAKVLNNMVSAAGLAVAAEALVIAERFGIAPETLVDVLNASTGRNNSTENKFRQFILNHRYDSGFALDLMVKDLGLAVDVARSQGVGAELGRACLDVWRRAQQTVPPGADHTEIAVYAGWGAKAAPETGSA